MTSEIFKTFIIKSLADMSKEELTNVIFNISDSNLDDVGKAVLAEQGRKEKEKAKKVEQEKRLDRPSIAGPSGIAPTQVTVPVAGEGGLLKTKVTEAEKSRKRKYDDVIDLEQDDLEEDTRLSTLAASAAAASHRPDPMKFQKITEAGLRSMLSKVNNAPRKKEKLKRLAQVMDEMDWAKIKCPTDLVTGLHKGLAELCRKDNLLDTDTMIVTRNDMEKFVGDNIINLSNHPMFLAVYTRDSPSEVSQVCNTSPEHAVAFVLPTSPPYDWKIIAQQLKSLVPETKKDKHELIINGFCGAYDNLIRLCANIDSLKAIYPLVHTMSRLAYNMSYVIPGDLKTRFRSRPITKLRDCLTAISEGLAQYTAGEHARGQERGQRQLLKKSVQRAEAIVKLVHPGYDSGFSKIQHWFD